MTDDQPTIDFPREGRIAALDYGTVRIGIAICDPDRILASPLAVIHVKHEDTDRTLVHYVTEERILGFVVGLPIHLDGRESEKSLEARAFAKHVAQLTGLPVRLFDERFSTSAADTLLGPSNFTSKKRQQRIDAVAAKVLLESFIEAAKASDSLPGVHPDEQALGGDSIG